MFMPYWFMRDVEENYEEKNIFDNVKILDYSKGYITKENILYNVYLVGNVADTQSRFADNIILLVQNTTTGKFLRIPIEADAGYDGRILLGDFDGNGVDDIFVSIASGGSAGYGYFYVYNMVNKKPKITFNFDEFNSESDYIVKYMDYYKVNIINQSTSERYIMDISSKGKAYLSRIYNSNGKQKTPANMEGQVLSLGELYPIYDYENKRFNLLAYQRIIGIANADTLGYVVTHIKWDRVAREFNTLFQQVSIFGEKIK